ncbi:MAG: hypothetical protein M5U35_12310 [Roseovarius sp.]|nr:hypothetical protein [Roseovarius sp.]
MAPQNRADGDGQARRRVVLGATSYADAEGGLGIAVELARHAGAELHGLLVRDVVSLGAVRVFRVRAVSFSGEVAEEVTETALLRAYQADARHFSERLRGVARLARLQANFHAIEGRLWETVQEAAGPGGVAVFGYRRAMDDSGSVVLVLGEGHAVPGFVAVLAAGLKKRLLVLSDASPPAGVAGEVFHGPDDLLRRLGALSPAAVIIAADPAILPPVARLVEAARCPVVVAAAEEG